jgi:DMSO reductase anchor subunit
MKPAPSIIGFTTASGLGYGMLFVLAIGALTGLIPIQRWCGAVALFIALAAITGGLIASTFHLGHPERARLAFSQWRSSWLSREGVAAVITYLPAVALAAGWVLFENVAGVFGLVALVAAAGAAVTVYCTGMIYASLPPIKAWHQPLTAPVYLGFALMTGFLAVHFVLAAFGIASLIIGILTIAAIVIAFGLKIMWWQGIMSDMSVHPTAESATGLGEHGLVRLLDPPHTQTNYLLDEMGFQIGRKHARMLRMLLLAFGLFLPLTLTLIALTLDTWVTILLTLLAFLFGMIGVLIERWLFFAEAQHTVMLYYGDHHGVSPQPSLAENASKKPVELTPQTLARPRRRRPMPTRTGTNIKGASVGNRNRPKGGARS